MLCPVGILGSEGGDPSGKAARAPEVPSQALQGAVVSRLRAALTQALAHCLPLGSSALGRLCLLQVGLGTAMLDAWKRRRLKKASPGPAVGCARPASAARRRVGVPRLKGGLRAGDRLRCHRHLLLPPPLLQRDAPSSPPHTSIWKAALIPPKRQAEPPGPLFDRSPARWLPRVPLALQRARARAAAGCGTGVYINSHGLTGAAASSPQCPVQSGQSPRRLLTISAAGLSPARVLLSPPGLRHGKPRPAAGAGTQGSSVPSRPSPMLSAQEGPAPPGVGCQKQAGMLPEAGRDAAWPPAAEPPPPPAHLEPDLRNRIPSLRGAEQPRPLPGQMPGVGQRVGFVITCYLIWSSLAFCLRRTVLQAHSGTMSH